MSSLFRITVLLGSTFLAGCSNLVTAYVRPSLPNLPNWQTSADQALAAAPLRWWESFGDSQLNALVAAVLANNNDLVVGSVRVRQALIQAQRAGATMFPTLTGGGSRQSQVQLADGMASHSFEFSLGASYEIDLWGRLASDKDAASVRTVAALEDVEAARVTVVAATIEAYWRLAFANQDLAAARASLDVAITTLQQVEGQVDAGAATELELSEVRQSLEGQAAQIADLEQTRVILRSTLFVLLNGAANPAAEPRRLPARTPVKLEPGLPAELLARRPDLRAAELRLRATLRTVDGTRASLYPQLTLNGSIGSTSADLLELLANPVATLGAGVALPFLNFADGKLRVKASETEYELAVAEFRTTLLSAFSDTANALSARKFLNEKARRLRAALEAATTAEKLTEERYRAGAVALRIWLDAQEVRRAAARALSSNRLDQLLAEVQIFRVLGGSPSGLVTLHTFST